jgi:hypothetical protein
VHLHLRVAAAEELERPVGEPAADISGSIEAAAA